MHIRHFRYGKNLLGREARELRQSVGAGPEGLIGDPMQMMQKKLEFQQKYLEAQAKQIYMLSNMLANGRQMPGMQMQKAVYQAANTRWGQYGPMVFGPRPYGNMTNAFPYSPMGLVNLPSAGNLRSRSPAMAQHYNYTPYHMAAMQYGPQFQLQHGLGVPLGPPPVAVVPVRPRWDPYAWMDHAHLYPPARIREEHVFPDIIGINPNTGRTGFWNGRTRQWESNSKSSVSATTGSVASVEQQGKKKGSAAEETSTKLDSTAEKKKAAEEKLTSGRKNLEEQQEKLKKLQGILTDLEKTAGEQNAAVKKASEGTKEVEARAQEARDAVAKLTAQRGKAQGSLKDLQNRSTQFKTKRQEEQDKMRALRDKAAADAAEVIKKAAASGDKTEIDTAEKTAADILQKAQKEFNDRFDELEKNQTALETDIKNGIAETNAALKLLEADMSLAEARLDAVNVEVQKVLKQQEVARAALEKTQAAITKARTDLAVTRVAANKAHVDAHGRPMEFVSTPEEIQKKQREAYVKENESGRTPEEFRKAVRPVIDAYNANANGIAVAEIDGNEIKLRPRGTVTANTLAIAVREIQLSLTATASIPGSTDVTVPVFESRSGIHTASLSLFRDANDIRTRLNTLINVA